MKPQDTQDWPSRRVHLSAGNRQGTFPNVNQETRHVRVKMETLHLFFQEIWYLSSREWQVWGKDAQALPPRPAGYVSTLLCY